MAARRILSRVSEAYGRMLLLDGLFQVRLYSLGGRMIIKRGQLAAVMGALHAAFAGRPVPGAAIFSQFLSLTSWLQVCWGHMLLLGGLCQV